MRGTIDIKCGDMRMSQYIQKGTFSIWKDFKWLFCMRENGYVEREVAEIKDEEKKSGCQTWRCLCS